MTSCTMPKGSCTVTQDDGFPVVAPSGTRATLNDAVADTLKLGTNGVEGSYVYLTAQVTQVILYIQATISVLEDTAVMAALKPYKMHVDWGITALYWKAQGCRVKARGSFAVQKLLDNYAIVQKKISDYISVVMPKVSGLYKSLSAELQLRFASIWKPGVAFANDSFEYVTEKGALAAYADMLKRGDQVKGNMTAVVKAYWIKIAGRFLWLKGKVVDVYVDLKVNLSDFLGDVTGAFEPYYARVKINCSGFRTMAETKNSTVCDYAKTSKTTTLNLASDKITQIRIYMDSLAAKASEFGASDGVAIAVVLGTSAGAAGSVVGAAVGAAMGVVPAVFTFGLSIPIGAAIGSGAGLCMGAVAGGATGLVGGKFVGKHKAKIEKRMAEALSTASACEDYPGFYHWGEDRGLSRQCSSEEHLPAAIGNC